MQEGFDSCMPTLRTRFAEDRVVRYGDLRPCTTAFIDARTPGSDRKENFTIIGPGVAENPDQHVHIDEPHGFNIGGARQPPGCLNSQHFHETAEVFFVHSGRWAFRTGEAADEGEVIIEPGDLISIPVRVFRGFENVGEETGFLYAVLGGDDPGRVTWAPDVLERARGHGLTLLESGKLLDTRIGGTPLEDDPPVQPTPRSVLDAYVEHADSAALERVVVRGAEAGARVDDMPPGVTETALIGAANPMEGAPAGPLAWSHGFVCRRLSLSPGAARRAHNRAEPEVLFVHEGDLTVEFDGAVIRLGAGDVVSFPVNEPRSYWSDGGASVLVTRGGDRPSPPRAGLSG
jgi:mannose-6-phosphate isomerase-like protein (cupin superfamily)